MLLFGMVAMTMQAPAIPKTLPAHMQTSFEVGNYSSTFPTAENSSYLLGVGDLDSPALGYEMWHDGLTYPDLYATSFARAATAVTNDFKVANPYFPGRNDLPPIGANITGISMAAIFSGDHLPGGYSLVTDWNMWLSINGGSSYIYAGEATPVNFGGGDVIGLAVNITGLEIWTPELVSSSSLCAKLTFTVPAYLTFYLDYLGLQYFFCVPPGVGVPAGGLYPNGTWDPPYYSPGDITIWIGFGGLLGMVATIPVAIWSSRRTGEPGHAFLGALVFGAVCFGLFMVGFG